MAWLPRTIMVVLFCSAPFGAIAQVPSAGQPPAASSPADGQTQAAPTDKPLLKPQELDQLVAPIALYPDPLLSTVLIASTYPLEVVQAERWLNQNRNLKGDQLSKAAGEQPWDDSLKALIATPEVLDTMSSKLDWTQKLGDAVLAQQADVMDAVQRLRGRAQANDKLGSTKEQKVTVKGEQNRRIIAIEPAAPDTMYVPYYDPPVVYGAWPDAEYPPYYWGYPGYIAAGVIATGVAFGAAYGLARWAGYWRGGRFGWGGGAIIAGGGARVEHWRHNAMHRGGAAYTNANVRQQFGGASRRAGNAASGKIRRAGNTNRAGAGNRTGGRQQARGAGGAKKQAGNQGGRKQTGTRSGSRQNASRGGGKNSAARQAHRGNAGARGGRHANAARHARPAHAGGMHRGGGHGRAAFAGGRGGGGRSFAHAGGLRAGGFRAAAVASAAEAGGEAAAGDPILRSNATSSLSVSSTMVSASIAQISRRRSHLCRRDRTRGANREARCGDTRGADGLFRVSYDRLGLKFQTYEKWIASGARVPMNSQ